MPSSPTLTAAERESIMVGTRLSLLVQVALAGAVLPCFYLVPACFRPGVFQPNLNSKRKPLGVFSNTSGPHWCVSAAGDVALGAAGVLGAALGAAGVFGCAVGGVVTSANPS